MQKRGGGTCPPVQIGVNGILEQLNEESRAGVLRRAELVFLPADFGVTLSRDAPRFAHFLVAGLACSSIALANGSSYDATLIGSEGIAEIAHLFGPVRIPLDIIMLTEGAAYRLPMDDLKREFLVREDLRSALFSQLQRHLESLAQLSACNHCHPAEARLARLLLTVADKLDTPELKVTHRWLAQAIGVQRPTFTVLANSLRRQGVITYTRGSLEITDRAALKALACECYAVLV